MAREHPGQSLGPAADGPLGQSVVEVVERVTQLAASGGLVVVQTGPGGGASWILGSAEAALRRRGWAIAETVAESSTAPAVAFGEGRAAPEQRRVAFCETVHDQLPTDDVVVTVATNGLAWSDALSTLGAQALEDSRLAIVRVPALLASEVTAVIHAQGDHQTGDIEGIVRAAGGNPAVACHLARHHLARDRALDIVFVNRLLDRYGPAARKVASSVALLHEVTLEDLPLVGVLSGLPPQDAAHEFDTLVAAGLVEAVDPDERYVVRIPWLADALYAALGPATREHLHRVAAQALASRPAVRHALVAHHILRTAPTDSEDELERLLSVADALSATAPDLSVQCYRRALDRTAGSPERAAELTARLARSYLLAGRPEEAVDVGRSLLAAQDRSSADAYPWLLPVVTEAMKATSAVEEAETMLLATNGVAIDELLDTHAAYLFAASGRSDEAQLRVRRSHDSLPGRSVRARVNMLSNLLHTHCIAANFEDLRKDATRLTAILDQASNESRLHAWATLAHVHSVEGDLVASEVAAQRAETLLPGGEWGIYVPGVRYARAAIGFARGDWDAALEVALDADEPLARSGTVSYLHLMRHVRARVLANRGEFTDARRANGAPATRPHFIAAMQSLAAAEIEILEGDVEAGVQRLSLALNEDRLPGEVRAAILAMMATARAVLGDTARVRDCVREVEQRWGLLAASRPVRLEMRLALAHAESDVNQAQAALEEAVDHGFRLFEGHALRTLGRLDEDPETHLTKAMKVYGDLGAVPWRRTTASELRRRGLRVPRRARHNADSLTETEIQLTRLVQDARSNKEIAEAMSLSVKTVEVYLSRLYVKVGCKNRLDLARAADDGRLPLGRP